MTEDTSPRTLLFIPGSLRAASFTTALLRRAATHTPDGVTAEICDLVRDLPHYNADDEGDAAPAAVVELRGRLGAASAIVIATPEYNGTVPGAVKDLLDWGTRPFGAHALIGKPVALIGASPNSRGARTAVEWLGMVLGLLGAKVAGDSVIVPEVTGKIHPDGSVDPATDEELAALIGRVVDLIRTESN